jgi:hypothetical protein
MTLYRITAPNGVTYQTEGPPNATPEQVKAVILKAHPEAAKPAGQALSTPATQPAPVALAPTRAQPAMQPVAGTLESAPLKDPGAPAAPWDYLTDRKAAIEQDRAYRAYQQESMQRAQLEGLKTQTGFFDRLGDLFSRGELSVRSGIKDIEAVIESDPVLKKQYQAEARRFAKDAATGIAGETTWEAVKDNPLKVLPFILEQGAQSLPQMIAGRMSPLGLALSTLGTAGQVARGRAEANDRQDVSGIDATIGIPVGMVSAFLDQFGLGEIVGTAGKNALIRTLKAAGAEGGTELVQNTLEYLGSRVGTNKGADALEALDQALAGLVAGGGMGAGLRGTGEAVGAVGKSVRERGNIRAEAEVGRQAKLTAADQSEENLVALSDALTKQYRRQGLTQKEAGAKAARVLPSLIAQQMNIAAETASRKGTKGRDIGTQALPGVLAPQTGGNVGSIASTLGPQFAVPEGITGAAPREAPTGQVGGVAPATQAPRNQLQEATEDRVTTALSGIDADFAEYADDINEAYGVKALEPDVRLQAAQMVAADPSIAPIDAIDNILKQRERVGVTSPPAAPPAPPSVDEAAVAPVADVIKQAAAPTGAPIPSLAETAARDTGITEAPAPEPAPVVEEAAGDQRTGKDRIRPTQDAAKTFLRELGIYNTRELNAMSFEDAINAASRVGIDEEWMDYYRSRQLAAFAPEGSNPVKLPQPDMSKYMPKYQPKDTGQGMAAEPVEEATPEPTPAPAAEEAAAGSEPVVDQTYWDGRRTSREESDKRYPSDSFSRLVFENGFNAISPYGRSKVDTKEQFEASSPDRAAAYREGVLFGANYFGVPVPDYIQNPTQPTPAPVEETVAEPTPVAPEAAPEAPAQRTIIVVHGGSDFEGIDPKYFGTGEPGNIRPLGNGMYGYVVDSTNAEEIAKAVEFARRYAEKYGRGKKTVHAFQLDVEGARTGFNGPVIESLQGAVGPELQRYRETADARDALPVGSPERKAAQVEFDKAYEALKKIPEAMRFERLPVGLTEVGVTDTGRLKRIGKIGIEQSDAELVKIIQDALGVSETQQEAVTEEELVFEELAAEEQEDEEIDYDEHPLMQEHEAKYENAIEEIGSAETMKQLRDFIKYLKKEGLIDADDVNNINDSINDAGSDKEERFDAGTVALEEALNSQRDNQREDVEERIREAVEAAPAEEAVAEEPTPEDAELARQEEAAAEIMAQNHADDFGGTVAFRDGAIGLIRGYSRLSGQPVYIPFNGSLRARVDIESFTGDMFTEEQLAALKQAKEQAEAADAAKDASDPFVKYDTNGLAVSSSVPENVAGVIAGWKQMLLPGVKLYVTTIEDAAADKAKFTGNTRAVGSAALDADEAGSARKIGPGEYYIAYTQGSSTSKVLELLAHEMGHVHEKEVFANASPQEKKALREAHATWLEAQSKKSARELVLALRARVTGRNVKIGEDIPASKLTAYWKSFSEWYADQTSRWAVSDEKPLTVVDKFFARLGAALRNFYKTLRAERYLPTETFTRFINATLKDLDVNPMDEAKTPTYDDVLDEVYGAYNDPEGAQISEQNFNLLVSAAEGKRKTPQELMDALEGFKDKYAQTVLGINPYEASAAKLSAEERAARKQARAEKDVRKLQYQIARSRNQGSLAEESSTLAKIVEAPEWIMDFTKDMAIAGYDKVVEGLLQVRSDAGVVRSATRMSKSLGTSLQRVVDAIQNMRSAENRALTTLMRQVQEWSNFDKAFSAGSDLVTDLANASTLHDINLAKYPTLEAFLRNDPKLQAIWNDPKLGDRAKLGQIENRQRVAKLLYEQWDMLDLPENGGGRGKAIYKMAADAYMATFNRRYSAIIANIENSGMSIARKADATARVDAMFASARQVGVYFPLMRFGEFWMRTGTGVNAEYSLFETKRQLEQAMRGRYKDMVANGYRGTYRQFKTDEVTFGEKLDDLKQQLINDPTKMLKGVYEALDTNSFKGDAKVLENEIFQLYVQSLPQGAQSREFIHRKGRTGFEADAIRAFLTHQRSAASQLARLEYGSGIRNAVDMSYSLIEGDPEGLRMLPYIKTMAEMARQELETDTPSNIGAKIANWVAPKANTIAYVYLMTQSSTALFQSAQLVMVGLPVMVREYGAGAFGQMFRYMTSLHKMLGVPMKDPDNPKAFMRFVMRSQPSINDSGYVNNMKDEELKDALKFAWSYGNDNLNMFGETFAKDTIKGTEAPSRAKDRYAPGAAQVVEGATFFHNFMTGSMHHMERMTRETMFMSAAELEFRKLRKQGFSAAVAKERAAVKAAALTREAMFVYTKSSKPLAMRGPLASMAFQFMSFPMSYLSIISRNFFDMVRLVPSEQGRKNATIMFTGMMGMLGILAGATGLPFYSAICGMIDAIRDEMRDEEEPEEGLMGDSNPLSHRSTDLWVRTWLLPHLFGTDSTIAKSLNLTPEMADKFQRAAEMGIPSAVTGLNTQSPLSADNMFMRDVESTGSIRDKVTKFMFDTGFGAIGGVTLQIADGLDLWQQGQERKAKEKLTPYGIFRAAQVAARLGEEGYTTRKGDLLTKNYDTKKFDAEYYTWGKLAAQFLGVRDAEVAELQKAQILAKDAVIKIQQDKAKVVDEFSRTRRAFVLKPSDENLSKFNEAQRKQAIYNIRYGTVDPITDDDLDTSYRTRTEAEWDSVGGLRVAKSYREAAKEITNR